MKTPVLWILTVEGETKGITNRPTSKHKRTTKPKLPLLINAHTESDLNIQFSFQRTYRVLQTELIVLKIRWNLFTFITSSAQCDAQSWPMWFPSSGGFQTSDCTDILAKQIMKEAEAVKTNHFLNSAFSKCGIIFSSPETLRLAQVVSNGFGH